MSLRKMLSTSYQQVINQLLTGEIHALEYLTF